ncbi:hypothetical protein ACYPKM_03755 [Pseudomonas aeruginosa]
MQEDWEVSREDWARWKELLWEWKNSASYDSLEQLTAHAFKTGNAGGWYTHNAQYLLEMYSKNILIQRLLESGDYVAMLIDPLGQGHWLKGPQETRKSSEAVKAWLDAGGHLDRANQPCFKSPNTTEYPPLLAEINYLDDRHRREGLQFQEAFGQWLKEEKGLYIDGNRLTDTPPPPKSRWERNPSGPGYC